MDKKKEAEKKTKRPTALKRDLQSEKRRLINKSFRSELRTAVRVLDEALEKKEVPAIESAFNKLQAQVDKGVKRGVFKKNKANRTKSRIQAKVSKATSK
jgi:small subunit ribosomal protein S20